MSLRSPTDDRLRPAEIARAAPSELRFEIVAPDTLAIRNVRRLIWVYFWLLIFEGALRKWFLPGLSNPLLIVRDPVIILIYFLALSEKIFPWNGFVSFSLGLAAASSFASIFATHHNIWVTLFGLRTNFLHLPLIFLIPKVFNLQDVEKIGKWLLITAFPMVVLVVIQFRSSSNDWVNVAVGGLEGGQLGGVGFEKIRPPGTFSFTSGLAAYLSLLAAFVMSWLLRAGSIPARIALAAIPALGIMIAVSASRTVLSSVVLILAGVLFVCFRKNAFFGKGVQATLLIAVVGFLLQFRSEVRQGMAVHEDRITTGGGVRGGLIDRTLGGFLEPFTVILDTPLLGYGIGMGTPTGAKLLSGDRYRFLLGETEWGRVVRESGAILGFAYLALRVVIVVSIGLRANRALEEKNPLPLILFCGVFPLTLTGQFGVPTLLGFATFGAGLCLAATQTPLAPAEPKPFEVGPESVTNPNRTVRGRSIYAEKLHGR